MLQRLLKLCLGTLRKRASLRTFDCPICGWSGAPSFELVDDPKSEKRGALRAKCNGKTCQYISPDLGPADFNEGQVKDKAGTVSVVETATITVKHAPQIQYLERGKPVGLSAVVTGGFDVIGAMRARRDYLELEVAKLDGLKLELRKLTKMLKVALREEAVTDGS